ncbi:biopolymer transporter ExbB [Planctomycetota bacterium]|nr:biopolymer transporter ExbB [Planctomycetota bacterium]
MRLPVRASNLAVLALLIAGTGALLAAEPGAQAESGSLLTMIMHGGIVELILIILSLISYSLALQFTFTITRTNMVPDGLADEMHNIFAEGATDEAVENARNAVTGDPSMLGTILAAMLDKKDFGYDAMRETAEQVGAAENYRYMAKVNWLSLFASTGTLLGLLGTVTGIIGSFMAMAGAAGGADPTALSRSIGEALVCTATGLIVAIGALIFFFFLRQRVNQASMDSAVVTAEILDYFRPAK